MPISTHTFPRRPNYLGVEAYGLIGVYLAMQAWIALLDLGMTPTLNREMARYKAGEHDYVAARRLLRTLECLYIVVLIAVILASFLLAKPLSESWLSVEDLSALSVERTIEIIGVIIATRWFMTLYKGAIMGLQEQVWLNKTIAFFATVRGLGVIPVIVLVSSTPEAFFFFQALTAVVEFAVIARKTYKLIPRPDQRIAFDFDVLKGVWNFAFGVFCINALATILTQADKILIALMLPLRFLGYYTLATSVCSALTSLTSPIVNGAYPRMTELIAKNEILLLRQSYHKLAQVLANVLVPAGVVISVFSIELLMLWTQNEVIAISSANILTIFAFGTVLNGIVSLPSALQLAYGYTRLMVTLNSVAVLTLVPLMYWCISIYGMVGAAYIWILLNSIYILVGVSLMHRKYLVGEQARWFLHAVIIPLALVLCICTGFRWWVGLPEFANNGRNILVLIGASILAIGTSIISTPLGRSKLVELTARHRF